MDEKEFLQEFIDFLKGVECLEFCYESNDLESPQEFNRTWKTDRELISSFLFSCRPPNTEHFVVQLVKGRVSLPAGILYKEKAK